MTPLQNTLVVFYLPTNKKDVGLCLTLIKSYMWSMSKSGYNKFVYVVDKMSIRNRALLEKYVARDFHIYKKDDINWNKRDNMGVYIGDGKTSCSELYSNISDLVAFDYILYVEPYTYLYPAFVNLVSNLHMFGKCNVAYGASVELDLQTFRNFDFKLHDFQISLDIKDAGSTGVFYDYNSEQGVEYKTLLINREIFNKTSKFKNDLNYNFLRTCDYSNIVTSGVYYINDIFTLNVKGSIWQ